MGFGTAFVLSVGCGAFGGAAAYLGRGLSSGLRALMFGLVAGICSAGAVSGPINSLGDRIDVSLGLITPMEHETKLFGEQLMSDPTMTAAFEGKSPAEAQQVAAKLARKGLVYMDLDTLQEWAEFNAQLADLSPAFCAARWNGDLSPPMVLEALEQLPAERRADWFKLSRQSMRLALTEKEPPSLPPDGFDKGMSLVFQTLSAAEHQAIYPDMSKSALPDERACQLFKLVINGALKLPEEQRMPFLRPIAAL